MEILPFCSQYIFFLLLPVVNNKHFLTKILAVHNNNIRSANNFHLPFTNLTKYQKWAYYAGNKIITRLCIRKQKRETKISTVNIGWDLNIVKHIDDNKYKVKRKNYKHKIHTQYPHKTTPFDCSCTSYEMYCLILVNIVRWWGRERNVIVRDLRFMCGSGRELCCYVLWRGEWW